MLALKFSQPGSEIGIVIRPAGREVEFRASDRGRGVPAELREAIFEPFRRADASDTREKGGTGRTFWFRLRRGAAPSAA